LLNQNLNTYVNANNVHNIGKYIGNAIYLDSYLTDIYLIDGQALTPSSFGSTNATTGQWSPAKYTGTYGTNGFHLPFTNTTSTTTLGYDTSGNGNNWTTNNISLTAGSTYDSMNDVPVAYSATAGNYSVLSPLNYRYYSPAPAPTLSNGNLTVTQSSSAYSSIGTSSMGVSSGKWYWEATFVSGSGSSNLLIGVVNGPLQNTTPNDLGYYSNEYAYNSNSGNKSNNHVTTAYGASFTSGDVIGVALDLTSGTITFYKNNTSQGTAYSSMPLGDYYFAGYDLYNSNVLAFNFGQQPFVYTPPSGYNALNTYNLPTPTIAQGNKYMDATLYTGNSSTQSITNAGAFKPDLVWGKNRSEALNHRLFDVVRGVSNALYSNTTTAETTESGVTAFNSNGFSLGSDQGLNYVSDAYVAWQWKANGAVSAGNNTSGTITSTVSANTTSGFSIVTYTGTGSSATVGHGLGVTPAFFVIKKRSSTGPWTVWTTGFTVNQYLLLNTTSTIYTFSNQWSALPTSTVLGLNTDVDTNGSGLTFVAYCFAQIAGFSAFGSYSGNSSNQFIYTGFQPKWVMIKLSGPSGGGSWTVFDTSRSPYNLEALRLQPNSSNAEASTGSNGINGLSNGFQLVGDYNGGDTNLSGYTYIYAAFASNPFAYSNAF
jgi:hypothetical protein